MANHNGHIQKKYPALISQIRVAIIHNKFERHPFNRNFYHKDLRKQPVPKDLPKQVLVKTKTESFNHQYYVAVRNGMLCVSKYAAILLILIRRTDLLQTHRNVRTDNRWPVERMVYIRKRWHVRICTSYNPPNNSLGLPRPGFFSNPNPRYL
jgi:hypothetical protein